MLGDKDLSSARFGHKDTSIMNKILQKDVYLLVLKHLRHTSDLIAKVARLHLDIKNNKVLS